MSPYLVPIGLLIGLSMGALGGGGSILAVPTLVYLFGQDPQQATTSSLVIVGATSLVAVIPHARAGNVRFGQGIIFGALGVAGSFAGAAAATAVRPEVLLAAFAALMLLVAGLMLRRSFTSGGVRDEHEQPADPMISLDPFFCACPRVAKVIVTATIVGVLTGFFGVGGGFALVPALVLAMSYPMPIAVGTSLVVIAVNSATALVARADAGVQLDWGVIAGFTAAAVVGSLIGGRFASRVSGQVLIRAFVVLLVAVATYTAVQSIPMLF